MSEVLARPAGADSARILWLQHLRIDDVARVGGKNASLGEMISQLDSAGVRVPGGFATTAHAYREFLAHQGLAQRIQTALAALNVEDVAALAATGTQLRQWVHEQPFPPALETGIREAYAQLEAESGGGLSVAVRSSATAEDLPDASFAGQQETFLNIVGIDAVLEAIRLVFASLYNDRAISYRVHQGYHRDEVALSAGIQRMVRSDRGCAGVMFTLDTESGFDQVVLITSSYGLGEAVVQGAVNPDEFYLYKPNLVPPPESASSTPRPAVLRRVLGSKKLKMIFTDSARAGTSVCTVETSAQERQTFSLTDTQCETLARAALAIEKHYGRPMDIEWGLDGPDGQIYILQARPETVQSRAALQDVSRRYRLKLDAALRPQPRVSGRAIGKKIGQGTVRVLRTLDEMRRVQTGDVLITDMTDPDWEPVMKRASAIVTNRGGRTCHAAIIARELGIPAVVGCGEATEKLQEGESVTVSCAEGDAGQVYPGLLPIEARDISLAQMPPCPTKLLMNVGNPELAFQLSRLPNHGVGLARLEFIINRQISIHPRALLAFDDDPDSLPEDLRQQIATRIAPYASLKSAFPALPQAQESTSLKKGAAFYVERLIEGIATIAAAFYPNPVIVRLSDFKSNEYANLLGGAQYEPHEENPMIGFRGASRYVSPAFRDCFALECLALRHVREALGFSNVEVMVPFVRTVAEATQVVDLLATQGLVRGLHGLRLIMMCEIPSNAILAEQFLNYFDGYSIGSNDMTQLTLALDRDAGGEIAKMFDERNEAVRAMLALAIRACRKHGKYIGICGQGPSDHPDLAHWLVFDEQIGSISLNPDTVVDTWLALAQEAARR